MEPHDKLRILAAEAEVEVADPHASAAVGVSDGPPCARADAFVTSASARGGSVRLLKVLQTSACRNNCAYCGNRVGRDAPRYSFAPDELARAFWDLYSSGRVDGLFLSSAVADSPVASMDRMLATVEILRKRYEYRGYVHLKILPGAETAQIEHAVRLADRVSANLEAPTEISLQRLIRAARLESVLEIMRRVRDICTQEGVWVSQTTQFVVGPGGETDRDLLQRAAELYAGFGIARAYYSAFRPILGTPLETCPATSKVRQLRLYQADFLLKQYRLPVSELPFGADGYLPQDMDPKTAIALRHPERFPVEVNSAEYEELLTVPGIGPVSASRILVRRKHRRLADARDLRDCGVLVRRAAPFVLVNGKQLPLVRPSPPRGVSAEQLRLF
ncbi:MAG: radical SAM protein [Armatimonadota bacterium]